MKNINGWLFLIIALMWLLPLVGMVESKWMTWVALIALAIIGFFEIKESK